MKKVLILLTVMIIAVSLCIAPAFGGACCPKGKDKTKGCNMPCPMGGKTAQTDGKCHDLVLAIDGMTCGGCEAQISKALGKLDGVICVESISHKDGKAVVSLNPEKADSDVIIKTVADLGYKVEIVKDDNAKACPHGGKPTAETAAKPVSTETK